MSAKAEERAKHIKWKRLQVDVEEKERADGMERARVLLCLLRTAFEHEIENKHDDVVDDKNRCAVQWFCLQNNHGDGDGFGMPLMWVGDIFIFI